MKHMNVKFFFAHDMIEKGLMEVDYCPTEEMWADVLTKPLQGKAFREMRSKLMNMPVDYVDPPAQKSTKKPSCIREQQAPNTDRRGVLKKVSFGPPSTRRRKAGQTKPNLVLFFSCHAPNLTPANWPLFVPVICRLYVEIPWSSEFQNARTI